jgi:hypothetical protein
MEGAPFSRIGDAVDVAMCSMHPLVRHHRRATPTRSHSPMAEVSMVAHPSVETRGTRDVPDTEPDRCGVVAVQPTSDLHWGVVRQALGVQSARDAPRRVVLHALGDLISPERQEGGGRA